MPLAEAKRLDVGLVTQQDVVVQASEIDLTMLVRNLVDNAIRYTPEGGRIDLSVEIGPDGAAFRVKDTGPGILPEDRERVFDPFHRLLGSDEFGSGLGLSIVKAIVDRLGAGISLGQSTGGGLEVTVTIPKTLIRAPLPIESRVRGAASASNRKRHELERRAPTAKPNCAHSVAWSAVRP